LPSCNADALCVQCSRDADCPAGFPRCLAGECQPRPCTSDTQCPAAGYDKCLTLGQRRVCLGCLQDTDCAEGLRCEAATLRCR
jgi:Cys-rich repeat protein